MKIWPLRFRRLPSGALLFGDDSGGIFTADEAFLQRYISDGLSDADRHFLMSNGHAFETPGDLNHTSFLYRWSRRQNTRDVLTYVLLVPTLRCNLTCTYCQVSRAAQNAHGYDWTDETTEAVIGFLDRLDTDRVKIEFQGGEPTLRIDLLKRVRDFARQRFVSAEFVVCTNLQYLEPDTEEFFDADDTYISTSLDGPSAIHRKNRTRVDDLTAAFEKNLTTVMSRFGERVSALPTIDMTHPPGFDELVGVYDSYGFRSIYLRPVNYQGFARSKGSLAIDKWTDYYLSFVDFLIERNWQTKKFFSEYYFTHCLKRVLQSGHDGHVDIRNPNPPATDYIVVDYDGTLYPTDEARMLARIGYADLSLGSVQEGLDAARVSQMRDASFNNWDPDCVHCAYQPFCGVDLVDDISRYGRIDIPRMETWFCRRQLALFDRIVELLRSKDDAVRFSISGWLGVAGLPLSVVEELA